MGKGGGGSPPNQQVTSTTSNLPEYAKPYFTNLLKRGQAESYREYTPYGGERIAGLTPAQLQVQRDVMGMEQPGQFGVGTGMIGAGGIGSLQYGQQAAGAGGQYFGLATDPFATQAFMSPYMQNVVDVQKQAAIRDAQISNLAGNLGAARQGTYGGARQLLAQTERERALGGKLGEIQAMGSQRAFEDAQRALQFGSTLGLQGLQAGLQGAQQATQAGAALGQLGTAQQQADLQRLQAQASVGEQQRALEQQKLDTAYADFLRQRDYPMEQLGQYSALLRGLPMQMGSTQTTYAPPPSIASQIGGMGLAGLSLASLGKSAGAFAKGGEVAAYAPGGAVSSPEKLDSMTNKLSDQQLQMQLRTAVPGTPEHLMVAGELQARKTLREKANVPKANPTPVIADLLTGGAMPQMPQQIAMLPENAGGVAALPAPNMENVATLAAGGLVAFEDGGPVLKYQSAGAVDADEAVLLQYLNSPTALPAVKNLQRDYVLKAFREASKEERANLLAQLKPRIPTATLASTTVPVSEAPVTPVDPEVAQRASDRSAFMQGLDKTGAALKDVLTLPGRAVAGAFETGVTRPLRAAGIDVPYLPRSFYGGDASSMTPYMDAIRRQEAAAAQAANISAAEKAIKAQTDKLKAGPGPNEQRGLEALAGSKFSGPVPGLKPETQAALKSDSKASEGEKPAEAPGGLNNIAKAQGLDYAKAAEQAEAMMGKKLAELGDPFKDIRDEIKKASEERKSELKDIAYMRLAEFGFGMAAGTSPYALTNIGKAGVEALKGYADDLREKKKLDRDDRKMLADIKRLEVADKRDNIIKTGELSLKILGEMNADQRAQLAANTQLAAYGMPGKEERLVDRAMRDPKFAEMYKNLNKSGAIDPRVKLFMDMSYAEKMQLKATNPTQYAMLEQLASAAFLPATVGTPDPSKIRP